MTDSEKLEELVITFWQAAAWPDENDLDLRRGIRAVLEIVEREQWIVIEDAKSRAWSEGFSAGRGEVCE